MQAVRGLPPPKIQFPIANSNSQNVNNKEHQEHKIEITQENMDNQ